MLLAGIVLAFSALVCYFFGTTVWFPPPANAHGIAYDAQFSRTLAICGIGFVVAHLALGFALIRRSDGRRPMRSHRWEIACIAVIATLFLGLGVTSTRIFAGVQLAQPPADAMRVEVLSRQFAWNFRYPGADGHFGRTDLKLVNDAGGNPFGLDIRDPAARDDVVTGTLKIPAGRPVLLLLHSRDVIHNFFVRELRVKQDIVPGMEIPLSFQADRPGIYEIPCSELCGLGHQQMRATLEVMAPADFDQWKQQTRK